MPNNPNTTHEIFSSRHKVPASTFVGQAGRMFYHEDTGELRLSDGVTPGGLPVCTGGTGLALNLYNENGLPVTIPIAVASRSIALGDGSRSHLYGGIVQASGIFTQPGDAQTGSYIARGVTSTSTFTELALDGSAAKITVQPDSTMSFVIQFVARCTNSVGQESGAFEVRGAVDRAVNVSTTRLVQGLTSKTIVAEDNPGWDVKVEADTFNGALRVKVQGENSKTIRWVAHIQTVEVHK